MSHPSSTKERLMNKVLAQMMIHCRDHVTPEQVAHLQTFKDNSADFDHTQKGYSELLDFNLDKYRVDESATKEVQEAPI